MPYTEEEELWLRHELELLVAVSSNFLSSSLTPGNTKGGSITVLLTSCLIGLDFSVLQIKTKLVSGNTFDSKPV